MKCIFLIANYNGMTSVIAALIADYIFDSITEKICGFPLALIAPLRTKQNNCGHSAIVASPYK
jgi:hypothetical protein